MHVFTAGEKDLAVLARPWLLKKSQPRFLAPPSPAERGRLGTRNDNILAALRRGLKPRPSETNRL